MCVCVCVLPWKWKCALCLCVYFSLKPGETETFKTGNVIISEPRGKDVNGSFTHIITQPLVGYIDGCYGFQSRVR